jgi:hypothetical protein
MSRRMINPFTHRKILKKGTPGTATIVSMSMPQPGASSQNIAMTLQVYVEGMNPYEVEDQWMVSSKDTLGFGMQLPVKVDPDKPEKVAIDWDAARSNSAAETTARRQALASQGPVGGAAAGAAAAAPSVDGVSDPLAGGGGAAAAGLPAGIAGLVGPEVAQQIAAAQQMQAAAMQSGMGGMGNQPTLDLRNDPELRAKLERVLGRELTPGTTEHIDTSNDPALAMQIMQVVQQHNLEKAGMTQPATADGSAGGDSISKLERLVALRDSGALTAAEFETQKRQILGG